MQDDAGEFATPDAALAHYRALCSSLEKQLADVTAELSEYAESSKELQDSSKELQDELEQELERLEKQEAEVRKGLEEARGEAEQWKNKFTTTLRDHTNTISHMQREVEGLRNTEKALRTKLRDMELDNDDLEKSEREKDSSLQDLENRYGKSIERIALLEEELVNKAQLEEECQRLKDELRDLEEEIAVMRTQAVPPAPTPSRPITPPGTLTHPPRTLNESPPPSRDTPSPFSTPRRVLPDIDTTPTVAVVKATPRPASASAMATPTRIASPPSFPKSISVRSSLASQSGPIARSARGMNLAQTAASSTPKAVREHRADATVKNMREMTERVKQLTSRLDSRRNLAMAGSSIPRPSMSPQSAGHAALTRSVTARKLTASALSQSQLSKTLRAARPSDAFDAVSTTSSTAGSSTSTSGATVLTTSTRPPSRSAMRMSLSVAPNRTAIPVRPPSRLGSVSGGSSTLPTPTTSRPTTPYSRSPTPSSASATSSSRPPWNSSVSTSAPSTSLASSARRRTPSTFGNGVPVPPAPKTAPLPPRRPLSTDGPNLLGVSTTANGTATNGKEGLARRASLALGRSVMRRSSAAHGGGG